MKIQGSGRYETPKEAGLSHIRYDPETREHTFIGNNRFEVYVASKNFAGYGLIYKNTVLEFVRSEYDEDDGRVI